MCGLGNSGLHRCNSRWNLVDIKWNRLGHHNFRWCGYRCNSRISNGEIYCYFLRNINPNQITYCKCIANGGSNRWRSSNSLRWLSNTGHYRCNSRWNMVYTKWNRLSHYQCESCRYRRNSGFSNGYIYSNKRQWLLNAATGTNASESHARKRSLRKRGTDVSVYRRARLSDESDMLHATSHTDLRCAQRGVFVAMSMSRTCAVVRTRDMRGNTRRMNCS